MHAAIESVRRIPSDCLPAYTAADWQHPPLEGFHTPKAYTVSILHAIHSPVPWWWQALADLQVHLAAQGTAMRHFKRVILEALHIHDPLVVRLGAPKIPTWHSGGTDAQVTNLPNPLTLTL